MAISTVFTGRMPVYVAKEDTDNWFLVHLVDATDDKTGETGVAHGSVDCDVSAVDGSDTWSAYSVSGSEWHEIGEGAYALKIGASEFATAALQYVVRVGDTAPNARKFMFVAEVTAARNDDLVRSTTPANALTVDSGGDVTIAASGIPVGAFVADSITASALATDAVNEISDGVWDEATSGHTTSGTFGQQCKTDIDAILVDTNSLNDTKITTARAANLDDLDAPISTVDTVVDAIKAKTDSLTFTTSNKVDSRVDNWAGTAVTISSSTTLPEVDAKSISNNAAAADNVQANIGNLNATISSRSALSGSQNINLAQAISVGQTAATVGGSLEISEAVERYKITEISSSRKQYGSNGSTILATRTVSSTQIAP